VIEFCEDSSTAKAPPPALGGRVEVGHDVEELLEIMAEDLMIHSLNCTRSFGDFHMALTGNDQAIPLYRHLMIDPKCRSIPWRKSHLWLVDDEYHLTDEDHSRWRTISEILGDHAGVPTSQQHPIPTDSEAVDDHYESILASTLEWRERGHDRLDYVFLTLRPDGSVAGLFPNSPAIHEQQRFVRVNQKNDDAYTNVVTMTLPLLNAARFIAIFVQGEDKKKTIQKLTEPTGSVHELPARGLRPLSGELCWYLTSDTC